MILGTVTTTEALNSPKVNIITAETNKIEPKVTNSYDDICLTPGCVHAASKILEKIDEQVEPCDDFYKFR